jgi:hypothetical protein
MSTASTIIWIVVSFISILLVAAMFILITKQKKVNPLIPPKAPAVINMLPQFANGHATGFEVSVKKGKSGRHHVTFLPNDLDEKFDNEGVVINEPAIPQKFIVENRMVVPTGKLGKRDVVFYLPKTTIELDSLFQNSMLEPILRTATNEGNNLSKISSSITENNNRVRELIRKTGGGEFTQSEFERVERLMKQIMDASNLSMSVQQNQSSIPQR